MGTSANTAHGIVVTFGTKTIGQLTNIQADDGTVVLDDTDLGHSRENNQAGIDTFSGSLDCLGDEVAGVLNACGTLSLSGTRTKDYGLCYCSNVGNGAVVKGQRTTRYTFIASEDT
jgi:hypothetical protein